MIDTRVEEMTVEAVIIRADGTRESIGTVGYYHRNRLKRWIQTIRKRLYTWQVYLQTVVKK